MIDINCDAAGRKPAEAIRTLPKRLHFSTDEFQARIAAVKRKMAEQDIDVLSLTAPENMFYLTGYDGWSFYTHQTVIIDLDLESPLWIGREMDRSCAHVTTWIPFDNIIGYPDEYVDSSDLHPMDFVAEEIRRRGWGSKRLGFEMESYYFTARCLKRIEVNLPGARIVDATNLVNWVRLIKSPRELTYMSEAAVIASEAMRTGIEAMRPGIRECDLAGIIVGAQASGTDEIGGDAATETIAMPVGAEVMCPHLAWTERRLEDDCPINLELGGVRRRYNAGISRSIFLGRAPRRIKELAAVTIDAIEQTLAAIRPGVTASSIAETYNTVVVKYGESKTSRVGYSIGIGYPPAWIERTVSLRTGDRTRIQAGMTFHLMCGMWRNFDGFVQSETLEVTDSGCKVLTTLPRGLIERH